ncbi:MAG: carbohydrate porin [Leptolyngbyaceae cyanobacterium RM1_406_9]|nr:carbohydrate porin [Leptolyngbyaceae cyanobacterium RM1_406_9]
MAASAQANTTGDRAESSSLETNAPTEDALTEDTLTEAAPAEDTLAEIDATPLTSQKFPQLPVSAQVTVQMGEKPQDLKATGQSAEQIAETVARPVALAESSSEAQSRDRQNTTALADEGSADGALESEAVNAPSTSLELGRLHAEAVSDITVSVETVQVVDAREAIAEEMPEAVTALRIPDVRDNTASDWLQVLDSLQTEFFTSGNETAAVSSSTEPINELMQILASLEAEFFRSNDEIVLNLPQEESALTEDDRYYSTPEAADAVAIAPLTIREPVAVSLAGVEAIAWTGAEAEANWQPLIWDCEAETDCYELSESDLRLLSAMPLTQASAETLAQTTHDEAETLLAQVEPEVNNEADNLATSGSALALGRPYIQLQGAYVLQGDESSARARATVLYPASPNLLLGGTVDLAGGEAFGNADGFGLELNELYATFLPPGTSGLRFTAGLMDLTSYFDRNSFAKDVVTHFFNPVFQTNPALSAAGLSSRIGAMAVWNPTDNVDVRATVFSSNRDLSEFALDAFAGEVGFRAGNLILRGTYISAEDPGSGDGFEEIFGIDRGDVFGVQEGDREEAFGLNAEYFIPEINLGLFARYGHYSNREIDESANTYSFGINLLDLFMPADRLGLAYGRGLSNDELRRDRDDEVPDVLELFYDVRLSPNLRAGATIQQRNEFSETVFGFRVRADLDVTGLGRQFDEATHGVFHTG